GLREADLVKISHEIRALGSSPDTRELAAEGDIPPIVQIELFKLKRGTRKEGRLAEVSGRHGHGKRSVLPEPPDLRLDLAALGRRQIEPSRGGVSSRHQVTKSDAAASEPRGERDHLGNFLAVSRSQDHVERERKGLEDTDAGRAHDLPIGAFAAERVVSF